MPYLPVDLDGKRKAEEIERALGLPRLSVVGGLVDLWEVVWRAWMNGKPIGVADVVDELALGAAFGPDPRVRAALVTRDFLETILTGGWRVRGAAKWLFGLEGKSRGGKAASGNLKKGTKAGKQPGKAEPKKPDSPAKPGPMPEDTSRLDPRLLHPAPSTQHQMPLETSPPESADAGWQPLVKELFDVFRAERGKDPEPSGRDWKALKKLRARTKQGDREIVVRWGRGLRAQFKQRVDSFWDLDDKWDSLASGDPPKRAAGGRFFAAQDADQTSLAKVGIVNDF